MDLHSLVTCLVAVTLLTITPGLDTLLIIRNTSRGGWRDGAVSSLGICSGLFIHASVSALGISILLLETVWAFTALKLAGAAYLLWLGLASWYRAAKKSGGITFAPSVAASEFSWWRSLREGFLSNVLNPKAVIFYMAFLPQFIDPARPALSQSLLVAAIHFTIAMLWQCLLAATVERARVLLQQRRIGVIFDGLTGAVMVYIGLRLVLEE